MRRFLIVDIVHHDLTERAVVKPVVSYPCIDHGIDRDGGFERGMRIHKSHKHQESVVGGADHSDAAVVFRHVFQKPLDRVVRVGRVIHTG